MTVPADNLPVECLTRFGLHWQPFQDRTRREFIYTDSLLEMPVRVVLDYLQHRRVALTMTGEAGIGKSTQIELLRRRGGEDFDFLTLSAAPDLHMTAIDAALRRRWPTLAALAEDHRKPVLIVDDAHRLPAGALKALLRIRLEIDRTAQPPLGLVLVAETIIAIALSEAETENRAAAETHGVQLRPYTAQQTGAYLEHRLRRAGLRGPVPLDEAAVRQIYRESAGLPSEINRLAREYLARAVARR